MFFCVNAACGKSDANVLRLEITVVLNERRFGAEAKELAEKIAEEGSCLKRCWWGTRRMHEDEGSAGKENGWRVVRVCGGKQQLSERG